MHRSTNLSVSVWAVVFCLGLYFAPLGVMAACIALGWHA